MLNLPWTKILRAIFCSTFFKHFQTIQFFRKISQNFVTFRYLKFYWTIIKIGSFWTIIKVNDPGPESSWIVIGTILHDYDPEIKFERPENHIRSWHGYKHSGRPKNHRRPHTRECWFGYAKTVPKVGTKYWMTKPRWKTQAVPKAGATPWTGAYDYDGCDAEARQTLCQLA